MDDDYRPYRGPLALDPLVLMADLIEIAGSETARVLRKKYRDLTRRNVGSTIRPGPDTPLWDELARFAASQVGLRYGDKAALGRILGVPRQRVHDYLVAKRACPDAERVLELLVWLSARIKKLPAERDRAAIRPGRPA